MAYEGQPGAWLKNALAEAKLTQAELARRTDTDQAVVSRWIHETRSITTSCLHAVATVLAEAGFGTYDENAAALLKRTVARFGESQEDPAPASATTTP